MKLSSILILGLSIIYLSLSSCRRDNRTEIPFVAFVEVPPGLGTILTYNFEIENVLGTSLNNISDAQAAGLRITSVDGELNLDILRRAIVNIKDDSTFMEVAYRENIPQTGVSTLDLIPSIGDVTPYITKDNFNLLLKLDFRYPTVQVTTLRLDFTVLANLND
ncbi:MAG: hypothetical protein MK212_21635 [Saprospiraceae bacterium]|nr:hypothetical protein [Saprospiraceae bacterium]